MPIIPGVVERAVVRAVDRGKTIGRETKAAARVVPESTKKFLGHVQELRDRPPLDSLQAFAALQTPRTRRIGIEREVDTREMTGDAFNVRVLEAKAKNPHMDINKIREHIRKADVKALLTEASPRQYGEIKKMVQTEGPITKLIDPRDPSKGYGPSSLNELRDDILEQVPGLDEERKKSLMKMLGLLAAHVMLDVGSQGTREEVHR